MKFGIFTKPQHVEKIVNYLNASMPIGRGNSANLPLHGGYIDYIISTNRWEVKAFDFDIGVSYCFPFLIDVKSSDHKDQIWFNYHPSLIGDWGHYAKSLKNKHMEGGVMLHLIDEGVDTGPVLRTRYFSFESEPVNTQEISDLAHYHLFQLFKETIFSLQMKPKSKEELDDYS